MTELGNIPLTTEVPTSAELDAMLDEAVILAPAASARNVIQPTAGAVIAAVIKAHASQSLDLFQGQLSDGSANFGVTKWGHLKLQRLGGASDADAIIDIPFPAGREEATILEAYRPGAGGTAFLILGTGELFQRGLTTDAYLQILRQQASPVAPLVWAQDSVSATLYMLDKGGRPTIAATTAPANGTNLLGLLAASQIAFWFDPTNGAPLLKATGRSADGTTYTWSIPAGVGYVAGGTDVAVADGGTGASSAAGALSNLGAAAAAQQIIAGSGLAGGGTLAADRTLDVNVDGSTIEINADTLRVKDAGITSAKLSIGTPSNDDIIQRKSGSWTNRTLAQLMTDLAALGTTFQPLDSDLTAIAALSTTSFGRSLLASADAAALRVLAATVIGTNVAAAGAHDFNGQAGVLIPTARGWTGAGSSWTNNRVVLTRFVLSKDFTVTSIKYRTTTGGTGNVDVGIYDSTLSNLLRSSGSTSGKKGANAYQTVNLSSTLALTAGTVYYAALESDTADGAHAAANFATGLHDQLIGTAVGVFETGFKDTTFPLPSSISTPTATSAIGPIMALV